MIKNNFKEEFKNYKSKSSRINNSNINNFELKDT